MSNNQSYQDNGQMRDVQVIEFDAERNMSDEIVIVGQAATYADALAMVMEAGYIIIDDPMYDIGHIANQDGPDAYGIPARQ